MDEQMEETGCCDGTLPLKRSSLGDRAHLFRALSDETRLAILRLLASQAEPLCVCHIVARFPLGQPTISHHLRLLREAGLVTVARRGTWAYYAPDPRGLADVLKVVAELAPAGLPLAA